MEKAQACAKQSNLPIFDKSLIETVNHAMIGTNEYVDKTNSWNKCLPDKCMWKIEIPSTGRITPPINAATPSGGGGGSNVCRCGSVLGVSVIQGDGRQYH